MINTTLTSAVFLGLVLFFTSCRTYYIPVDSFKQQFAGLDSSSMREVTTEGPMGHKVKYKTYPIDNIQAVDKNGNSVTIPNSPALEIRITDTSNKKTIFYFDLIRFDGQNIMGRQSRFMPSISKTIPISSIRTIEVQNGRKKFSYVK